MSGMYVPVPRDIDVFLTLKPEADSWEALGLHNDSVGTNAFVPFWWNIFRLPLTDRASASHTLLFPIWEGIE